MSVPSFSAEHGKRHDVNGRRRLIPLSEAEKTEKIEKWRLSKNVYSELSILHLSIQHVHFDVSYLATRVPGKMLGSVRRSAPCYFDMGAIA
jgi:hypothetical protein